MADLSAPCDLSGQNAVVTGAAGGVGAEIALYLERAGVRVFATDLDKTRLAQVRRERGAAWDIRALDVSNIEDVGSVVGSVCEEAGKIDILVNCAGIYRMQFLPEITEPEWDRLFAVNVKGAAFMTQAVAQSMTASGGGGVIVNVASAAGRRATEGSIAYSASKAAVISLTQGCASELAARRIRVNAIAPGAVETEMWDQVQRDYEGKLPADGPTVKEMQIAMIPLGRICSSEDCARAVLSLASDQSAFVTGQTLNVDGGLWMN